MAHPARHPKKIPTGFHDLMKELLQYMQINPASKQDPEVYSFTFDGKTEVKLFSKQPGMLDIVLLSIGTLEKHAAAGVLLNLLHLNHYSFDGPCLNLGVEPASGKICLWSRQSLADMTLQKLVDLLHAALARASAIRQQQDGKPAITSAASRRPLNLRVSAAHLRG